MLSASHSPHLTILTRIRDRIPVINGWLLAAMCFALVTHAAPVYILSAFMLVLTLAQPGVTTHLGSAMRAPVNWAFIAYFGAFLISMLWTENDKWGWRMVWRQAPFLLFPMYWLAAQRCEQQRCISFFIGGVTTSIVLAYYNWIQLHLFTSLPESIWSLDKSPGDIAPFVDRIMYSPILAFGAYFAGYRWIVEQGQPMRRLAYAFLFIAIVVNLLLSGGRAGMVGFFVLLVALVIQRLYRTPFKAALLGILAVTVVVGVGYNFSSYLRERINAGITELSAPRTNINTSVGLRINFLINTSRIIAENPVFGVGVGDFPEAYKTVNDQFSPQVVTTPNPHNQVAFVLATTGLLGGAALIFMIWTTLTASTRLHRTNKHYVVAIWIGFGTICLFESYLWRSNTALMFSILTALAVNATTESEASKDRG